MTAAMLLKEALKLPLKQREKLCEELQDSLPTSLATALSRRLEAHRQHPDQVISREALETKWQEKWGWKP
jgi:putative addiction module component (TIGR02574 family)